MASSLAEVKEALKNTLAGLGLQVYPQIEAVVNGPACVITLDPKQSANFAESFSLNSVCWYFNLLLLVGEQDMESATNQLDAFVTQRGPSSVREYLFSNRSLGLSDATAFARSVSNYGGTMTVAGNKYMGATVRVEVTIT